MGGFDLVFPPAETEGAKYEKCLPALSRITLFSEIWWPLIYIPRVTTLQSPSQQLLFLPFLMAQGHGNDSQWNHLREFSDFSSIEPSDSLISGLSSYPLSLPSEPPNIGKWFSSYQYESPSQDYSLPRPDLESSEDDEVDDERNPIIYKEPTEEAKGATENLLCSVAEEDIEDRQIVGVNGSSQISYKLSPNSNTASCKLPIRRLPSRHEDNVSECGPRSTSITAERHEPCGVAASNHQIKRSSSDENSGGWVSTRTLKKDMINKRELYTTTCAGVKPNKMEFAVKEHLLTVKRSALADKTNRVEVHAELDEKTGLSEIPGNWNCPRKNRPESGPPLKQLRLERWVHRVV